MPLLKYLARIKRIDELISKKRTGDSYSFAKKLNLSRQSILIYLTELKQLGFPIKFCKKRNSYYYEEDGSFVKDLFEKSTLSREDLKKISGGSSSQYSYHMICNNIRLWDVNLCNY